MWNEIVISGFADEIDSNLVKQITVLKKLNMKHIEMRGVNGKNLVDYSITEAKEIKYQLDAEGISLSSVGSPIGKISITDDFLPHLEKYKHTVELAHLMETPYIRMFSFYIPEGAEYEGFRSKVMEQMGEFVDYAKVNNVTLLHENEKGIYGDNAVHCAE
ncbi:MAG: TIM barrel protein, partial [Clostridiales bacterium]|nr:TIM barrel protein [Clostridiales bacterium]